MEHETFYAPDRQTWRRWLEKNHNTRRSIWLVYPHKSTGRPSVSYNDAVEEALCFGWIDSTLRSLDEHNSMQRYSVRNPKSEYSQLNKERVVWLHRNGLIHPSVVDSIRFILEEEYVFPEDILDELRRDPVVWENYNRFSESYRRLRIAYIERARGRDEHFAKRLQHFIEKTRQGKLVKAYGGAEKYY